MIQSTLRLFNAVQVVEKRHTNNLLLERTILDGYVLAPEVAAIATHGLLKEISAIVGLSGEKANSAFHKNWQKVRDARIEQLVLEQLVHYFSTYGLESVGLYREDSVYIPHEKLKIPALEGSTGFKLTVIRGLTRDEILEKILSLAGGVALSKQTLDDIIEIEKVNQYKYSLLERNRTKNRELRARLYAMYDLVPSDPEEFLRFVITDITGDSLLIKNKHLLKRLEGLSGKDSEARLNKLFAQAPVGLASIFYRYKPIFLALKKKVRDKNLFNRLRKDAVKQHVPLKPTYLSTVTSRIKHGLGVEELYKHLESETIFRKARLAQALRYRTDPGEAIVYRIRNGKGFATDFSFHNRRQAQDALQVVLRSIQDKLNVKGKTIYIPSSLTLTLPATEKQFIGNFPIGSSIRTTEDLIVGIHWTNVGYHRIDLDLAGISLGGKVGWDGAYRSIYGNGGILFSGDMTDAPAPKGASEFLQFKGRTSANQLISVNYFNYNEAVPVPASIIVAFSNEKRDFGKNYVVNPNNMLATSKITIEEHQSVLGMVLHTADDSRFYFVNSAMGSSRSIKKDKHIMQARQFMTDSLDRLVTLKEVLVGAGANVVDVRPEGEYVDLSPESLDKTTIIGLLR